MKKTIVLISLLMFVLSINSCNDNMLDFTPKGVVSQEQIEESADNIEGLVIAAYAGLGNDNWFVPHSYPWPFGSVRADDAYKGGLGTADIPEIHRMEVLNATRADDGNNNRLWERIYISIGRANTALTALNNFEGEYPERDQRIAEMRFLRGHFYFLLKVIFKHFPYIDETIPVEDLKAVSNREFSNDELWEKIADEFEFASNNLPLQSPDIGRADQLAAKAYLAKVRLFQAYEQSDETHQVVNINDQRLEEVVNLTGDIISSGEFDLFDDFAQNFLWEFENGIESIFAVQRTQDDGTPDGNLSRSTSLNYPVVPEYGCCSFNRPSQTMVNAFQTDGDGLPNFEGYNNVEINTEEEFNGSTTFDPRLGHTVSIPGKPYKYQNNLIYDPNTWTRAIAVYGVFSDVKPVQQISSPGFARQIGDGFPSSSKNEDILRYSEVLLWRAEALIELGRHMEALPLINEIRGRAQNSTELLVDEDSNPIANFSMSLYQDGQNINWTQANARRALRWENRLEFAMEGKRFFDLVRWGIAESVMNEYFEIEQDRHNYLGEALFIQDKSEYLPIPEQQIDFSEGVYEQNLGY